jgi:hypothetical protein
MNFLTALPRFLRTASLASRAAFIAATFVLVLGSMGGPLVASAESRSGESQDNAPANERPEEFTTVNRCDHARQLKLEQLCPAVTHKVSFTSRLGTTLTKALRAPDGHRLSNGLLAPLTC